MNIRQLLELARNPHYQLSPEQLKQLEEYRRSKVRHNPTMPKHETSIKKHSPELEQEEPHGN